MQSFAKLDKNGRLTISEGITFLSAEMLKNIDANSVKIVDLPNSLAEIGDGVFKLYHSLMEVNFGSNLKKIGNNCFSHCWVLKKVDLPEGLEEVGEASFLQCPRIGNIILPISLKCVKEEAFRSCGQKEIFIPKNLISVGMGAFFCKGLQHIVVDSENSAYSDLNSNVLFKKSSKEVILGCLNSRLNEEVEVIGEKAFYYCEEISSIEFPSSLREIKYKAFGCSGLEIVKLPKTLIKCEDNAFEHCQNLKTIQIEEGFKKISEEMFAYCYNVHEIEFPAKIEIGTRSFLDCKLQNVRMTFDVFLCSGNQDIVNAQNFEILFNDYEINLRNVDRYSHSRNGMVFKLNNNQLIFADLEGNIVNEKEAVVFDKATFKNDIYNESNLRLVPYIWEWRKQKNTPHIVVIENMPISDAKNFSKDNNAKNWYSIIKEYKNLYPNIEFSNIKRELLFKIAYALGVFSDNGKQSEVAKNYIIEQLLPNLNNANVEKIFLGFNTFTNIFNVEFANFFFKYFNVQNIEKTAPNEELSTPFYLLGLDDEQKALVAEVNSGKGIEKNESNFFALCYNNFNNFHRLYSSKKVKTRLIKERVTPTLIASSFKKIAYQNVAKGAEKLSEICALYALSQEQFEKVQQWYLIGKSIDEKNKSIFVFPDEDVSLRYELLNKSNEIIPILGILTNCCQKVDDMGEVCLEYGMTKPNSDFLKLELDGELFGQCWLWYDEQNNQLTIDNIEISRDMENRIKKSVDLQDKFVECLNRFVFNAFLAMRERGILVNKITMGLGHNFFQSFLVQKYELIENPKHLSGYNGYRDSTKQVMLLDINSLLNSQSKQYACQQINVESEFNQ